MGPWRAGGIWINGRGMKVDLVGMNKVLSEEGETSELTGDGLCWGWASRLWGRGWPHCFAASRSRKPGWREPSGVTGPGQGGLPLFSSSWLHGVSSQVGLLYFTKGTLLIEPYLCGTHCALEGLSDFKYIMAWIKWQDQFFLIIWLLLILRHVFGRFQFWGYK